MKFEKVQGERVIAYVKCPYCGVIEKVYYYYGDFEPGNPFVITLTMYGTIPYYGISYETADGETHYYAISESGMDGSAILVKFEPKEY